MLYLGASSVTCIRVLAWAPPRLSSLIRSTHGKTRSTDGWMTRESVIRNSLIMHTMVQDGRAIP